MSILEGINSPADLRGLSRDELRTLAQDMRDKMVKALKALIPSDNNKKIIEDMLADPVYGPKLKQLDIEEE